jgi:hypothetical protein
MHRLSDAQLDSIELTQREKVSAGAGTSCLMQLLRAINELLPEKPLPVPEGEYVAPAEESTVPPVSVEVQETTP